MPDHDYKGVRLDFNSMSRAEREFLTQRPERWDNKVIDGQSLARGLSLHPQTRYDYSDKNSNVSLGQLDVMAQETREAVLEQMNVATLMRLRQTNSKLRHLIGQWRPFHDIMTKGRSTVRALLATATANSWTAVQLQPVLFMTRCELCHEHGEFIQLIKLMRCCFRCLSTDRRLLPVCVKFAQNMGVPDTDLRKIPRLRTIPRRNHWGQRVDLPAYWALDYEAALRYGSPFHTKSHSDKPVPSLLRKRLTDRPSYHTLNKISPLYLMTPENDPFRFLSAIHQPPRSTQPLDPVYCRGCRHYWNCLSPMHYLTHTLYTTNEISAHLETCPYAYIFWGKLYPDGDRSLADEATTIILLDPGHRKNITFPRHVSLSTTDNQYYFEVIPIGVLRHLGEQEDDIGKSFFGDANGQASWATARRSWSSIDLFDHYTSLMNYRKNKMAERLGKQLGCWGFDRI